MAKGGSTNCTFAPAPGAAPHLFRVETISGGLPATFSARARRLANNSIQLEWNSAVDHGYRVEGSTNFSAWTPCSAWIQASGSTTTFTLPPWTNGAPNLFRIEVQP